MIRATRALQFFLLSVLWVAAAATTATARNIDAPVRDLIRGNLRGVKAAVYILDLADKRELASLNADREMIPASNMKLITTAAALDELGPDFKFRTRLRLIERSDWEGHAASSDTNGPPPEALLLIKGDGDPTFGDPIVLARHDLDPEGLLDQWVEQVQSTGRKRFDALIVDDRVFDQQFIHETWPADQLSQHYCAQVAGVNFHRNILVVTPHPRELGQTPHVALRPEAPFVQTHNFAKTAKRNNFYLDRRLGSNKLTFKGTVAAGKKPPPPSHVTLHDPAYFFAQLLADRLGKAGIEIGRVRRIDEGEMLPDGQVIMQTETTLFEVIERCNTNSQNLYAESLLKRMGHAFTGAPGSWSNGSSAIRGVLQERLGTSSAVTTIADGSGLSRENRVTARLMVKLMRNIYEDPDLGFDYFKSLAVAGDRGSLTRRFTGPLKKRVFAKTGYINGVCTLSGFLVLPEEDGGDSVADSDARFQVVVFSLLFNDIPRGTSISHVQNVQDRIVRRIAGLYQPATSSASR